MELTNNFNDVQKNLLSLVNYVDAIDTNYLHLSYSEALLETYTLICKLPRQAGKSTFLQYLANTCENPLIVVPSLAQKKYWPRHLHSNIVSNATLINNIVNLRGTSYTHLLLDEVHKPEKVIKKLAKNMHDFQYCVALYT